MRKGFTRKPQADEPATRVKNYITPSGLQRLKDEHQFLLSRERPAVVEVVAWAAGNGDRSENADYQYGKRRLRQIDGRIRFLTKRIEAAEVVAPEGPRTGRPGTGVFFGVTVRYANGPGAERVVSIVGTEARERTCFSISSCVHFCRAVPMACSWEHGAGPLSFALRAGLCSGVKPPEPVKFFLGWIGS